MNIQNQRFIARKKFNKQYTDETIMIERKIE